MSVFGVVALASPLLLGFAVPFAAAWATERNWPARRRAGAVAAVLAGWCLLLAVLWIFSGQPVGRLLESACFLLAFGAFLFGLFHLFAAFRLPPAGAQAMCGIVVVLLVGTVFYYNPIVEQAERARLTREQFYSRLNPAVEWNPYVVMSMSIFEKDPLQPPSWLYGLSELSDKQRPFPDWTRSALWYVLLGFWGFVVHVSSTALRMKLRGR